MDCEEVTPSASVDYRRGKQNAHLWNSDMATKVHTCGISTWLQKYTPVEYRQGSQNTHL